MKKGSSVQTIHGNGVLEAIDDSEKKPRERKFVVRLDNCTRDERKRGSLIALNEFEFTPD
jgi:hypothetical protein